ncbi:MAG: hypothetical protein WBA97_23980 [Actinophytocola sp.]|uniref:hypothetical protein n=1 Tax=Actinophytocola sp. TaxID=1872138 RepID=UPI003C78BF16
MKTTFGRRLLKMLRRRYRRARRSMLLLALVVLLAWLVLAHGQQTISIVVFF